MKPSPITSTIDFDTDGVHHGFLQLPYSHDASAWGSIMIPITVVKNGEGPCALLTGANHGDEYEGPIALQKLAASLKPEDIKGRVILMPALNYPAFLAGRRTSPIDHGNMNRVFPGKPDGTITEKIADYVTRHLLPLADYVVDIHAGGKTLDFVPFAGIHFNDDKDLEARTIAAMEAFNAPYGMMFIELDNIGMYDTTAEQAGKVFVSTELGGGGSATAKSVAIADKGIRNLLIHVGILKGEMEIGPLQRLDVSESGCYHISEDEGLFEICADLGDWVEEGQDLVRIYDPKRTGAEPKIYKAKKSGLLAGRHFPGLVNIGDCLAVVATEVES